MSSSTSTWNAGSFAAASASMKAIRLMPAYCAARSCETRPWRYQSIPAARRISFANASGDSAIGARVSRGNSIRMACSACCTLMPCSPHQPRLAGTGRLYDPTRDARRQVADAVAPRGGHERPPGPLSFMRGSDTRDLRCGDRPGPARPGHPPPGRLTSHSRPSSGGRVGLGLGQQGRWTVAHPSGTIVVEYPSGRTTIACMHSLLLDPHNPFLSHTASIYQDVSGLQ
jgi:hypothetical protein